MGLPPPWEQSPELLSLDLHPSGRYNMWAMWIGRASWGSGLGPLRGTDGRFNRFTLTASGFTLTELMVVVVLVAILAAIAIPLYDRHIRQTKASEARSMIGAIVAAEKAYAERNGVFLAVSRNSYQDFLERLRVDVKESELFDYEVSMVSGKDSFTVTAWVNSQGVKEGLPASGFLRYVYNINSTPRGRWEEQLD